MMAMMDVLYTLPRTIVLLLQPMDVSQYANMPDRGFICDVIRAKRLGIINILKYKKKLFLQLFLSDGRKPD